MEKWLKRIGESNRRVTKDKIYSYTNGHITDDNGMPMRPHIHQHYWVYVYPDAENPCNEIGLINDKEKIMSNKTTVETVTLINGKKSDDVEVNTIIQLIESEEAKLERLNKIKAKSPAIDKLRDEHNNTIAKLLVVLSGKE